MRDAFEKTKIQLAGKRRRLWAKTHWIAVRDEKIMEFACLELRGFRSRWNLPKVDRKAQRTIWSEWGGSESNPKFPMPAIWAFVIDYALSQNEETSGKVFLPSKLGMGGNLRFSLRGGLFSRYFRRWWDGLAPHFEKMGYGHGEQLVEIIFQKAYQNQFRTHFFLEKVSEKNSCFGSRSKMPSGGKVRFHSAQDADSEGVEGENFTREPWCRACLEILFQTTFALFSKTL